VSRISREYGIRNISQPCKPTRPLTYIVLLSLSLYFMLPSISKIMYQVFGMVPILLNREQNDGKRPEGGGAAEF
jgi:hypothetical protein